MLTALFEILDRHHFDKRPADFRPAVRSRERTIELIENPSKATFVVDRRTDRRVVGFTSLYLRTFPANPVSPGRTVAEIDSMVVHPDFRHHGVATLLLQRAREWATEQQVACLELNVWEFNSEAMAFYEATGFAVLSRRMRLEVC